MPLTSDVLLDPALFDPASVSEETKALNQYLIDLFKTQPKWWEVGAAKYRQMRANGETALPGLNLLPGAVDINIPSREAGRNIPCRLVYPTARDSPASRQHCKGTILHVHGGGWVFGSHQSTDSLLQAYADWTDMAVISAGYRLAPEHPHPQGLEDCIDTAMNLYKNSVAEYGGPLKFMGGESAGGHLALVTALSLIKKEPRFELSGLLLHFGVYDLTTPSPSTVNFNKDLVLSAENISHLTEALLPEYTTAQRQDPTISPIYEDLHQLRGRLPDAFFTCGTEDLLLDHTINMGMKWAMAGAKSVVKIYSGAPHGFIAFGGKIKEAGQALEDTKAFINERLVQ